MSTADLPYGGTQGHNAAPASADRAREEARAKAGQRQSMIAAELHLRGYFGATWKEISSVLGLHAGQASSSLTSMHQAGTIVRLKERRNRCHIYVMPKEQAGREEQPFVPNRAKEVTCPGCGHSFTAE